MVALDDTFTESARVKTNDPSTRGTTEEFEPPFMKETKHTNYIFNQGMESGFWEKYFQATLQRGRHVHQSLLASPAFKDTEEPDKLHAQLDDIAKECSTRLSRHKSIVFSSGEDLYKTRWPGVTYFTDKTTHFAPYISSKVKIAIIFESSEVRSLIYDKTPTGEKIGGNQMVTDHEEHFDLIFTYDNELLKGNPYKYKLFTPFISTIEHKSHKMHEKSKLVSMFVSGKKDLNGHKLRHIVAKNLIPKTGLSDKIEIFGSGVDNPIKLKSDGCNDFMFQIAIENGRLKNYFTDKILDCFITGTIPIYWGCPNIGDFFDERGIITFNTPDELKEILESLTKEKYSSMLEYAKINFEKTRDNHTNSDDALYKKIIEYPRIREILNDASN